MSDWDHTPPKPPSPWDMDKRIALLEQSQKDIREELHSINSNITRLVWIVVAALVTGLINLLLRYGSITMPGA